MKRKLAVLAFLVAAFSAPSLAVDVSTCQDFQDIDNDLTATYELQNDINCQGQSVTVGTSTSNGLEGTIDGNGYTVSNIQGGVGVVDRVYRGGTVRDITFDNISMSGDGTMISTIRFVNGIDYNLATIKNVAVTNSNINITRGTSQTAKTSMVIGQASALRAENLRSINNSITEPASYDPVYYGTSASAVVNQLELDSENQYNNDITFNEIEVRNVTIEVRNTDNFQAVGGLAAYTNQNAKNITDVSITGLDIIEPNRNGNSTGALFGLNDEFSTPVYFKDIYIAESSIPSNDDGNNLYGKTEAGVNLNFEDVYYDSQTTDIQTGNITSLTTAEMTGSSAATNMDFDYQNTWRTRTGDYPQLKFYLNPTASLSSPTSGEIVKLGETDSLEYSVDAISKDADFVTSLTYPNGTTVTTRNETLAAGNSQSYSDSFQVDQAGTYNWEVNINSGETVRTASFEAVDYHEPVVTNMNPDGETYTTTADFYRPPNKVSTNEWGYGATINTTIPTTYAFQTKRSNETTWQNVTTTTGFTASPTGTNDGTNGYQVITCSTAGGETCEEYEFLSKQETRDWRVKTWDDFGSYTTAASFNAEQVFPPSIDSVSVSPQIGSWFDGDMNVTVQGTVNDHSIDNATVYYNFPNNPSLDGNVFVDSADITQDSNSFNLDAQIPYDPAYQEEDMSIGVDVNDVEGYSDTSADAVTGTVPLAFPTINQFTVEPNIGNIQPGEYFNLSVEGDVNADSIDTVEYSLQVDGHNNPSPITKSPNFQDQNQYTDSEQQAFQMKQEWQGSQITLQVTVTDTEGRSVTDSQTGNTATPPDSFILNQPSNGQVFLIPQGDTEIPVTHEWGVNTAENPGTAELVIDGGVVDSFSINADSQNTVTYSDNYSEGSYNWKVRFTDSTDSSVYESQSRSFDVTDEPINLRLQDPSGGESISMGNSTSTDVDHVFEIDARALDEDHYYTFTLNNTDSNSNVVSRTTGDRNTGINTRTQTVSGLSEGNYSWGVKVYRSSDDTLLESKTTTYTLERNPKFTQQVYSPGDGETIVLDPNRSSTQVETYFEVESFATDVDTTVQLDGAPVSTVNTPSNSYRSYRIALGNLSTGNYTYTVESEDGAGRTTTTQRSFEIVESAETEVSITELSADPPIDEWQVGDNVTIYFETTGDLPDVEYFQLDITADGETVDTIFLPRDQLREGSVIGEAYYTVTDAVINSFVTIGGEVLTSAGDTLSTTLSGEGGSSREPSAYLFDPAEGETIYQASPQDTRFAFNVFTVNNPISWTAEARNVDEELWKTIAIAPDNVQPQEGPEEQEFFVNLNGTFVGEATSFDKYYTDYVWRVNITEQNTGVQKTFYSDFNITNQTGPILNWNSPAKGQVYPITQGDTRNVPFNWRLERSGGSGTVSLSIEGDEVRSWNVDDGTEQGSYTEPDLGEGVYSATLEFHSDQYDITEQRAFSLRKENASTTCSTESGQDVEINTVRLRKPADGTNFYRNVSGGVAQDLAYEVCGAAPGNTSLRIYDSSDSLTYIYNDQYSTGEKFKVYQEALDTSALSTGQYTWAAQYTNEDGTFESLGNRSFKIVDFTPPRTYNLQPDGENFVQGENIEFSWTTESFDEDVNVELVVRPEGQYGGTTEFTSAQAASKTRNYNTNISKGVGQYEWFVRMKTSGLTFESNTSSFTVVSDDIQKPNITAYRPRQDERFQLGNKSEVPVKFNWSSQVYSETDASVRLQLWNTSEDASTWENIYSSSQNVGDQEVSAAYTENLTEAGYRWRVQIEYPNGKLYNSTSRSFAVGEADIPSAEPARGIVQDVFGYVGSLNREMKAAAGPTGQFFLASLVTLMVSGLFHLYFRMDYLTMASTLLLVLGFSLADGYFPLAVFYIVAAISAAAAAFLGAQILGGES